MQKITDWSARRSGASMTVTGKRENGDTITISNVTLICPARGQTIAQTKSGTNFHLVVQAD